MEILQVNEIAKWYTPGFSNDLPDDFFVEVAAMIVNGQAGHAVDMSDSQAFEEIKKMAREHRDIRKHEVKLHRVSLRYKAIRCIFDEIIRWEWEKV